MLNKLLFKNQDYKQLLIASIGGIIGLVFVMASVHYLLRIEEYGEGSEILGSNVILVQKKVSNAAILQLNKNEFSSEEIEEFRQHNSVEVLQPVRNNNFKVWLETDSELVPIFKTDAFIQSISKEFMDTKKDAWNWNKKSDFVPIIMPRDFLVMLNTFMSASGMPQVSDEIATSLPFKLRISNDNFGEWQNARIIGFTNEMSALLVPMEFMEYANDKFGGEEPEKITQLIVKSKEGMFGELEKFLENKQYEPKETQMIVGRLKSFISTLIYIVLFIAMATVFAFILVILQYLQLLVYQNKYEIKTLLNVGYAMHVLVAKFIIYFLMVFITVTTIAYVILTFLVKYVNEWFEQAGIFIGEQISLHVFTVVGLIGVLYLTLSYFNARRTIRNQFKNSLG